MNHLSDSNNTLQEVTADKVPAWLDDDFFDHVLKSQGQLNIEIVSVKPAVGAGENYASGLYRVKVATSVKKVKEYCKFFKCCRSKEHHRKSKVLITSHSFIVKCGIDSEVLKAMPVFPREIKMYSDIIPKLEWEYQRIGEHVQFGPRCYFAESNPNQILVFDDLRAQGYAVQNRHAGLDMDHCVVFLQKLAKFHAASAVYHSKNGDFGTVFRSMYSNDMEEMVVQFNESVYPLFLDAIKSSEILSKYVNVISQWKTNNLDELIRMTTPDPHTFNVLNHADLWLNNFMFSHDENKHPNDVLFIDYQISFWASPAIDLYYFFITSTDNSIRAREFDTIVQLYHVELVKNLINLGYVKRIPTLKDLHIDLMDKRAYPCTLLPSLLPIILVDPRDDANINNLMGDTDKGMEFKRAMYKTPRYIRALEALIPLLAQKGLLSL